MDTIIIYSKGSRGLSVLLLLRCIFTENSISLSQYWRQRKSRYTIHAGRNLPDKGFRYLRTVMVTAAVCWDLYKKAKYYFNIIYNFSIFIDQHRAGVRPYTSFYNFAESCVFNKQSLPPILFHLLIVS
jgi:hypothetical protein